MKTTSFTFTDKDGKAIFVHKWEPESVRAKGIVQIIHGISEHSGRYARFAETLTGEGFIVFADDHRGHGKTSESLDDLGYAGEDGWNWMVNDEYELTNYAKEQYPGLPLFILGHSMGSFILRHYMYRYGKVTGLKGYILSGTGGAPYLLLKFGQFLCKSVIKKLGRREKNKFIHELTFMDFNRKCKEKRTLFDWLSRDRLEVDKYIEDPYCGQICTAGFYLDFFTGMLDLQKASNVNKIPKDIPIFLFSGEMDPVGQYGKKVKALVNTYEKAGICDVSYKLYSEGRHEMLNEINRDEVMKDVIQWINLKIES